ncbi:hypothetical protein MLD38_038135 [Melastoma candidum]|uniref:Uncharacterized protein n=1 Tax=Melastoma candidum TaxID=119954 RepID=A0ACB9KZ42_9MYRT|nr:hypothetical protein MLD38_038135 [Melastoma candidum]
MSKNHWIPRDTTFVPSGEINYDNSLKSEGKRSHQWFMDAGNDGPELFGNKRQAVEAITGEPVQGSENIFFWDNNSSFQSLPVQPADQLGGPKAMCFINLADRQVASLNSSEMCMARKFFDDQYGNELSVNLSMSHSTHDPSLFPNFGGIRKVRVNEVRDPDNNSSTSVGDHYGRSENGSIPIDAVYDKAHSSSMSLGMAYHNRNDGNMSMEAGFGKIGENFMSVGHSFNKDGGNFISMGQAFDRGSESMLSLDRSFPKEDGQFITMGPPYAKREANVMSMVSSFNKDHADFISMGENLGGVGDNFISVGSSFGKVKDNLMPIGRTYDKADSNAMLSDAAYQKGDPNALSMSQSYAGMSNIISFGSFLGEQVMNAPMGMIGNYDLLLDNNNLRHASDVPVQKNVDLSRGSTVNNCSTSKVNNSVTKNKEQKTVRKPASNNFPSNVKSLLSTGMLDGVSVKYVSWSREMNLRGIISGSGYRCGCPDCNLSKSLNAYEFERHAGCKTKHPNNHIYFENGKTIYAVVQELKNTPQELLFDAIQTVTGSPINQKNYRAWKESYQAATRELQRIYGKDEIVLPA